VRPEPARQRLVGRARLGGLDARVHAVRPRRVRAAAGPAAPLPPPRGAPHRLTGPPPVLRPGARRPAPAPARPPPRPHPPAPPHPGTRRPAPAQRCRPPRPTPDTTDSPTRKESTHAIRDHALDRRPRGARIRLHPADHEPRDRR